MPVLGLPQTFPPPPPPGGDNEDPSIDVIGMDGTVWSLNEPDAPMYLQPGPIGQDMAPYGLSWAQTPARHGATLVGVRSPERTVTYPVMVKAPTRLGLRGVLHSFARLVDPTLGPVTIRITERNGTGRQLSVYYAGGMEGDEGRDTSGRWFQRYALRFTAPDPFWQEISPQNRLWVQPGSFNQYPLKYPLSWSPGQVIGTVAIDNFGDVPAYPIWTITGPFTAATITNTTTGKAFAFTAALTASHYVIVDTRPGVNTVTDDLGANRWSNLAASPQLWSLLRGVNVITLTVTGATSATKVAMQFTPRYVMA